MQAHTSQSTEVFNCDTEYFLSWADPDTHLTLHVGRSANDSKEEGSAQPYFYSEIAEFFADTG